MRSYSGSSDARIVDFSQVPSLPSIYATYTLRLDLPNKPRRWVGYYMIDSRGVRFGIGEVMRDAIRNAYESEVLGISIKHEKINDYFKSSDPVTQSGFASRLLDMLVTK